MLVVGAENLYHQVIFVDDATSAVTPLDAEMIQISNAIGQAAERRGLLQGAVRPVCCRSPRTRAARSSGGAGSRSGSGPVARDGSCRSNAPSLHDRIHPRRLDRRADDSHPCGPEDTAYAERRELAVDAAVYPGLILTRRPQYQRHGIAAGRRVSGAVAAGPACPAATEDVTVPPQDGAGSDDEPQVGEAPDWQRPGQQRQPRPIRPRQPRMSPWLLALGDSQLMVQDQDLGVLPPHLRWDKLSSDTARVTMRKISSGPQAEGHRTRSRVQTGPPATWRRPRPRRFPRICAGWQRFSAPAGLTCGGWHESVHRTRPRRTPCRARYVGIRMASSSGPPPAADGRRTGQVTINKANTSTRPGYNDAGSARRLPQRAESPQRTATQGNRDDGVRGTRTVLPITRDWI